MNINRSIRKVYSFKGPFGTDVAHLSAEQLCLLHIVNSIYSFFLVEVIKCIRLMKNV